MKLSEVADKMDLRVFGDITPGDGEVKGCYVSDLLSDVMGNAREGEIWITLQNHLNVVAIASLKELAAIVLVNNIEPGADLLARAAEEGVPVLGSNESTFITAGKAYTILKA